MELRFTEHAILRMRLREITVADIEEIIQHPTRTTVGGTEVVYDGTARGRGMRIVVDRDSDPPWVVTVMFRRR